jgi:hypothetical protein
LRSFHSSTSVREIFFNPFDRFLAAPELAAELRFLNLRKDLAKDRSGGQSQLDQIPAAHERFRVDIFFF